MGLTTKMQKVNSDGPMVVQTTSPNGKKRSLTMREREKTALKSTIAGIGTTSHVMMSSHLSVKSKTKIIYKWKTEIIAE